MLSTLELLKERLTKLEESLNNENLTENQYFEIVCQIDKLDIEINEIEIG